ncbi:unnamed protein product [Lactuca saligna]|uniref:Uncharacterized protein n=1 Tax=Lactuca saligna TaxID=75948 RepID=A0AA35Z2N2_LACSI|nr:unnamed protein product [Lactuca saligna]
MVVSSETASFAYQSTTVVMLNMKPSQNLILDHTASCYNEALRPMVECLCVSPLAQALTMAKFVPLIHLSKAYFSASFVQVDDVIHFEVASCNTFITKALLCRMLRFGSSDILVDPNSISATVLIDLFLPNGLHWGSVSVIQVQEAQSSSHVEWSIHVVVQELL